MARVHDVAAYILQQQGPMTTMKLQKLLYYTQAWSLVWEDRPMFASPIQAWANGPVIPEVYKLHRGVFQVSSWPHGDVGRLKKRDRSTIDAVLKFYGPRSPHWLSEQTHYELPWREARGNTPPGQSCSTPIRIETMQRYYSSLN